MSCRLIRQVVAEKIEENEKAIEQLTETNRRLRRELASLDAPSLPLADEDKAVDQAPYAFMRPQEAVLKFLRENLGPHKTIDIANAVVAGGMESDATSPRGVVYTALRRQAGRDGPIKKLSGGRWKAVPVV